MTNEAKEAKIAELISTDEGLATLAASMHPGHGTKVEIEEALVFILDRKFYKKGW